jgi:hypothetical protein
VGVYVVDLFDFVAEAESEVCFWLILVFWFD